MNQKVRRREGERLLKSQWSSRLNRMPFYKFIIARCARSNVLLTLKVPRLDTNA